MKKWDQIKNYFLVDQNKSKVNYWFCILLFVALAFNLINTGLFLLPEDPLFFFTSDAFEMIVVALMSYSIYNLFKKIESVSIKTLASLLSIILLTALAFLKAYRRNLEELGEVYKEFTEYIVMAFIFLFLFYFFDNINQFINNSHEKTKKALKEAEHQLLRQQFNPHFLYNAFNSLYSMSLQNNPKTSDSILKLSSMMRYLTDDISPSGNLLKQEFKFIKDYIEIEKIRFGEKAKIGFDIIGEVEHQIIEPLILINLVENAFKHGFYTNNSNAFVDIKATVDQSNLSFSVRNSCFKKQHFQESERLGKGIDLLKKRLDLVYPHNAVLTCKQTNEEYVSVLNINLS